jgi:hypothetical protein
MSGKTYILVGGPDSGKSNYIARLWEAVRSKTGTLVAPVTPKRIKFVEDALEHLLKGEFVPRSSPDVEESAGSFEVSVRRNGNESGPLSDIIVPDVTGELWKKTLETSEIPQEWLDSLESASGALLLVRIGSKLNEVALDWVTCAPLLRRRAEIRARQAEEVDVREEADDPVDGRRRLPEASAFPGEDSGHAVKIPTQIALCEFLRFLEYGLKSEADGSRPRVAVLVTAWDRLDPEKRVQGPTAYLRKEYPMFAGRLDDIDTLEIRAFGISVVSGDLDDPKYKEEFYEKGLHGAGYVVTDEQPDNFLPDLTLPVSWVMNI